MFGRQSESGVARSQSLIQEGVAVRGDIKAEGDIRLDGMLEGALVTKSRLTVGGTGVVHADLEAGEVLVMGKVCGKIVGHKRIELRKGAHVEGDLSTQAIVIEEGVFFRGHCQMTSPAQPLTLPSAPTAQERRAAASLDAPRHGGKEALSGMGGKDSTSTLGLGS